MRRMIMSPRKMQSRAVTAAAFIKAGWWIWGAALAVALVYPDADDFLVGLYVIALFHMQRYNYWAWNGNERLHARRTGRPAKTWPPYIGIANVVVFLVLSAVGWNASRGTQLALFFAGFASAIFWLRACCYHFCWWIQDEIAAEVQASNGSEEDIQHRSDLNDPVRARWLQRMPTISVK
jgi:hypothetical protein